MIFFLFNPIKYYNIGDAILGNQAYLRRMGLERSSCVLRWCVVQIPQSLVRIAGLRKFILFFTGVRL